MKLCVFDFDSTLMDGETIDEIASVCNKKDEIAKITEIAMAGRMDFFKALTTRVSVLKGIEYSKVIEVCHNLPLMPGAYECIDGLKKLGYKVIIFSGGFRDATTFHGKRLGVDADFANILYHENGYLTGEVGGDMMFGFSKGDMLNRLQNLLGISEKDTIAVGDGANDASMFKYADKKVAFCAKEVLKKEANIIVDKKDLKEILKYI